LGYRFKSIVSHHNSEHLPGCVLLTRYQKFVRCCTSRGGVYVCTYLGRGEIMGCILRIYICDCILLYSVRNSVCCIYLYASCNLYCTSYRLATAEQLFTSTYLETGTFAEQEPMSQWYKPIRPQCDWTPEILFIPIWSHVQVLRRH